MRILTDHFCAHKELLSRRPTADSLSTAEDSLSTAEDSLSTAAVSLSKVAISRPDVQGWAVFKVLCICICYVYKHIAINSSGHVEVYLLSMTCIYYLSIQLDTSI